MTNNDVEKAEEVEEQETVVEEATYPKNPPLHELNAIAKKQRLKERKARRQKR